MAVSSKHQTIVWLNYEIATTRFAGLAMTLKTGDFMTKEYCVYIVTNRHNTVLYTGVTNDLKRRVLEHNTGAGGGFTKRYNVVKLIYFEVGDDINKAIFREKQIKSWNRKRKEELIYTFNPEGKDLYNEI